MLDLSSEAADFIMEAQKVDGKPDHLLRVARGRENDNNLFLSFVATAEPGDDVGESNGVHLCVAGDVSASLDGKRLEVRQTNGSRGLVLKST